MKFEDYKIKNVVRFVSVAYSVRESVVVFWEIVVDLIDKRPWFNP